MNCMSNVMEPGQTFNVKKKTGEGSRDVDKEVIATIKKNPTYLPALADKLYCLKQPIEVCSRVFFVFLTDPSNTIVPPRPFLILPAPHPGVGRQRLSDRRLHVPK